MSEDHQEMGGIGFTRGAHYEKTGFCAMEWIALVRHGEKTEFPACTWHGILPAVWHVNDLVMPHAFDNLSSRTGPVDMHTALRFERLVLTRIPKIVASRFDDDIDDLMLRAVLAELVGVDMARDLHKWIDDLAFDQTDEDGWGSEEERARRLTDIFESYGRKVEGWPFPYRPATDDDYLFGMLCGLADYEIGDPSITADICTLMVNSNNKPLSGHTLIDRLEKLCDLFDKAAAEVGLTVTQNEQFDLFLEELASSPFAATAAGLL